MNVPVEVVNDSFHHVTNRSDFAVIMQVRTTHPRIVRVHPSFAILQPNSATPLRVHKGVGRHHSICVLVDFLPFKQDLYCSNVFKGEFVNENSAYYRTAQYVFGLGYEPVVKKIRLKVPYRQYRLAEIYNTRIPITPQISKELVACKFFDKPRSDIDMVELSTLLEATGLTADRAPPIRLSSKPADGKVHPSTAPAEEPRVIGKLDRLKHIRVGQHNAYVTALKRAEAEAKRRGDEKQKNTIVKSFIAKMPKAAAPPKTLPTSYVLGGPDPANIDGPPEADRDYDQIPCSSPTVSSSSSELVVQTKYFKKSRTGHLFARSTSNRKKPKSGSSRPKKSAK